MQTLKQWRLEARQVLAQRYDDREAVNIISYLLEERMQLNAAELTLISNEPLEKTIHTTLGQDLHRLTQGVPVQYILGYTQFHGMQLSVAPAVLIPRPETEELVSWILQDHAEENLAALDVGTGSGCIALALKSYRPHWDIMAVDVDADALDVARENAEANELDVELMPVDFLNTDDWSFLPHVDLLVSNPPYITTAELADMESHVLAHEPMKALVAEGEDPLIFYRRLAGFARKKLAHTGAMYLELNALKATEIADIIKQQGFKVELRNDMQGRPRMLKASFH